VAAGYSRTPILADYTSTNSGVFWAQTGCTYQSSLSVAGLVFASSADGSKLAAAPVTRLHLYIHQFGCHMTQTQAQGF